MGWSDTLLPASWRGLQFAVDANSLAVGRRLAVHEYPYRDEVWPEDLGRAPRRHSIQGFIVGDDVDARRRAWITAAETAGPGILIHPSLGSIQVTLLTFSSAERKERGRVVELQLEFIVAGLQLFPAISLATAATTLRAATGAIAGVAASYAATLAPALVYGVAVVEAVQAVLVPFGVLAASASGDAAQAATIAVNLAGNFGRYGGTQTAQTPSATVSNLLAAQTAARAAVAEAVAALPDAAEVEAPVAVPAALEALLGAVRAVANDPPEQIRVAATLAAFAATAPSGGTGLGDARRAAAIATAALARRHVVITMAQAAAAALPGSYDEAVALRDQVTAALDAEITAAGDLGEDDAYFALRDLRTAVAADLTARAANLARLRVFTFGAPLPALVLGQMIYRDGARGDDLARRADPPHPAFMPVRFRALAV